MTIFHRICKFTRFGRILSFSLGTALLLSSCSGLKTTPVESLKNQYQYLLANRGHKII